MAINNEYLLFTLSAGFFTAPVNGVYYFQFTMFGLPQGTTGVAMYLNNMPVMHNHDASNDESEFLTNSVILELKMGDELHLVLPRGFSVYDDVSQITTFSGALLFTL